MLSKGSDPANPPKQTFELIFFLIPEFRRHEVVIKPVGIYAVCVSVVTFTVILTRMLRKLVHKTTIFCEFIMKMVFLFRNIVGTEYLHCLAPTG